MANELQTISQETALQNATTNEDIRLKLQNFTQRINAAPKPESIGKTPDKKANTILISHIEMTLDEYCFGLWSTENFRWTQCGNEVVGAIDLKIFHPVAGVWITRQGAAAITIMVDAVPERLKWSADDAPDEAEIKKKERNAWALDMQNKKPSALDMSFPKLKAECLKNAAQSLGSLFGRDLNRKAGDVDSFQPLIPTITIEQLTALFEAKKEALTPDEITHAERIISNKETASYKKLHTKLQGK